MTKQIIDLGTPPGGIDGDTVYTAFSKSKSNFDELYDAVGGLSNVDNTADADKPVSTAQQAALDALIPPGYIDGLKMVWVSGTALTVTSGAAYVPSLGKVLRAPTAIAKTGLSLSASTWYHVYLYDNAGTPDVEIVTTAPAAPYNGTARSKTGDTSRRYVGSIITTTSGAVFAFRHSGQNVAYLTQTSATPFRVLSAGAATTETTVSAAPAVPLTSTVADVRVVNNGSDVVAFGTPDDAVPLTTTQFLLRVPPGEAYPSLQLSPAQGFTYLVAGSGGTYVDVRGYTYER